ncbi:lytic transglycosylase domain-containing protein [Engelhardtia mirabilis]|uniref:lytic transglycosylase domain-containing protein n=1 Tax=Engelhardtia mirabilis TaxID=2528011 RepID=UPI003AF3D40E
MALLGGLALVVILVVAAPWGSLRGVVREELAQVRIARLAPELRAAAQEFAFDPYLLAALVFHESSGRVDAVSSVDALGLVQLKLETARERARVLGLREPERDDLLEDAGLNLRLGAAYLAYLVARQEGSLERALMAYNAGPTKFDRWLKDAGGWEAWSAARAAEGLVPFTSVRAFAARVIATTEEFRAAALLEQQPAATP